jgi:hypothetical protein
VSVQKKEGECRIQKMAALKHSAHSKEKPDNDYQKGRVEQIIPNRSFKPDHMNFVSAYNAHQSWKDTLINILFDDKIVNFPKVSEKYRAWPETFRKCLKTPGNFSDS